MRELTVADVMTRQVITAVPDTTFKKPIADLDARKKRLIRTLEVTGDDDEEPDQELIQDIKNRRAEIKAERATLAAELETLEEQGQRPAESRPAPLASSRRPHLDALPEDLARKLFEALRVEIHYNKTDDSAVCRITLSGETLPALQQTTQESGVVLPSFWPDTPGRRSGGMGTVSDDIGCCESR